MSEKVKRGLSGMYFREGTENICLEDMTKEKRDVLLKTAEREFLIGVIDVLCDTLNDVGEATGISRE